MAVAGRSSRIMKGEHNVSYGHGSVCQNLQDGGCN